MANRVTADEVKEIIDTGLTDPRIDAFITGANQIVTSQLKDDFEEPALKEIERWLAAHFIAANIERQAIQEKAGPAEQKFSDQFGMRMMSTTFGQTAASLDSTGKLAALGQKKIMFKSINEEQDNT